MSSTKRKRREGGKVNRDRQDVRRRGGRGDSSSHSSFPLPFFVMGIDKKDARNWFVGYFRGRAGVVVWVAVAVAVAPWEGAVVVRNQPAANGWGNKNSTFVDLEELAVVAGAGAVLLGSENPSVRLAAAEKGTTNQYHGARKQEEEEKGFDLKTPRMRSSSVDGRPSVASPKSSHFRHATSGLEGSRVQPLRDEGLSLRPATAWEITRGSTAEKDHAEGTMKRSASEVDGSSTRMATKGGTKLIPKISMAPIRAQRNSKRTRTKVERKEDFLAKDRTFGAHGKGTIAVGKRARRSDGDRETKLSLSPFLPLFLPPSRCCPTDGSVV
ncbi:hypothetical protein B296_00047264 [Ensete ventricosum]|uniref:Uncharacterized protein n=1 Tax=Ensete ventricosum TaxID=4639 RepID=A0A426Y755_ENSVE|nr:hypothetical protein B296_00047264 [Ensete ventricosum]